MFDRLFVLCEDLNIQRKLFTSAEVKEDPTSIEPQIAIVLSVISGFVQRYCKDMLPVLFEVCNILSKERVTKRRHICGEDNYGDTFQADQSELPPHDCLTTITDLIYMHSMLMRGEKDDLTNILYSLFMNPTYKLLLVKKYVERYMFLFGHRENGQFLESELGTMYTQFFSRDQITTYLNSPFNHRPAQMLRHYYEGMLTANFRNDLNGLHSMICKFQFMQGRIETLELQLEGFNILNELMKLAFVSVPNDATDTQHQKFRLIGDNMVLLMVCKYLGSFKYDNVEAEKLLGGLVILYFTES